MFRALHGTAPCAYRALCLREFLREGWPLTGSRARTSVVLCSKRFQSSTPAPHGPAMMSPGNVEGSVTHEQIWALWNEGNLFSLSVLQMQEFLTSVGVQTEAGGKKAALVRRVEEYLHAKENTSGNRTVSEVAQQAQSQGGSGRWGANTVPPETLLDLAQAGFYEGAANMAPKAFQLLADGSTADVVVSRVNTTAFPGFPANTECYTLSASEAEVALRSRFSKAFQWCLLNMSNLRMDGELSVTLGKLLLLPKVVRRNEHVVSTYTLQQRLQLKQPYTWVSAVPESSIPAAETFLQEEGFLPVKETSLQMIYDGTIKRSKDHLRVELDASGKLMSLNSEWVNIHTVHYTHTEGPDVRFLLRSRPPIPRQEFDTYGNFPIVELANDDVSDVLPPERGQLVYLSENVTRRFQRVNNNGVPFVVTEVKRQPLIVVLDEEEDPRVEYTITVGIPPNAGGRSADARVVGMEVFELAQRFAVALKGPFASEYGCTAGKGSS